MNRIPLIFFVLFAALAACKTARYTTNHTFNFDYRHNWKYFDLQDTITIKIISHLPAGVFCGTAAFASVSLAETSIGDTIRIISLCNMANYAKDQVLVVKPGERPNFFVNLPYTIIENPKTKKLEPISTDLTILRTTYGYF